MDAVSLSVTKDMEKLTAVPFPELALKLASGKKILLIRMMFLQRLRIDV